MSDLTPAPKSGHPGRFLFALAVLIVLGAFSAWRLSLYRTNMDDLHDHIFRSAQYVGNLNTFAADFRVGEATSLLSTLPADQSANNAKLSRVDDLISLAQHSYEHVRHGTDEARLYLKFRDQWLAYRRAADQVRGLASAGRRADATALYLTSSRAAYEAANQTLDELGQMNVADAGAATLQADVAFRDARFVTLAAFALAGLMTVSGLVGTATRLLQG